jgi:hypothetical protein
LGGLDTLAHDPFGMIKYYPSFAFRASFRHFKAINIFYPYRDMDFSFSYALNAFEGPF